MSERFLLDSNVISELAKPTPALHVIDWVRGLRAPTTSAIVCYEVARGIERQAPGKRRAYLERWFAELLSVIETLPVDESSALAAARIERAANRNGRTTDVRDLLIAATAQVHGCAVATRNAAHFTGMGLVVYDPFSDMRSL